MFSPWTMKGERPLSRFMHYAEGEAPQDRGAVCGSSIYSCFETGCFMPGSPRGTLQIPSRLLATQPWRSCLADHQGPELPALLGKATVMLPANYVPGHLVTWSIASNRLTKVDHNRLTYLGTTRPHLENLLSLLQNGILQQLGTRKEASENSCSREDVNLLQACAFLRHLKTGQGPYLPFALLFCLFPASQSVSQSFHLSARAVVPGDLDSGVLQQWVDHSQA